MAIRGYIHKTKLEEFKLFLRNNQIQYRDGKGDYEVIQIKTKDGWKALFLRYKSDHFTVPEGCKDLKRIVFNFVKSCKEFKNEK